MMIGRNTLHATAEAITLQYANGKTNARLTPGTGRFIPLVGFHAEIGRDADFDVAMQAAKIPQIEIKHQRPGGAENVRHWSFGEHINFYPITSGPVALTVAASVSERNAQATAEAGIGMRWGNGERSHMALRGYLDVMVRTGSMRLVQIAAKSRMTDMLLAALLDHLRVIEIADHLIDRSKHPEEVTFHEVALPLGPGSEQEWGKADTATVVPLISLHPKEVTADYLRTKWRPESVHASAQRDWAGIQVWANDYATTVTARKSEEQSA